MDVLAILSRTEFSHHLIDIPHDTINSPYQRVGLDSEWNASVLGMLLQIPPRERASIDDARYYQSSPRAG
jgi:hypothetical protein